MEKKIEKIQQKQVAVQALDKFEPKPVPLSAKVMQERKEIESLFIAAKKYAMQEKKDHRLQRMLDAANKTIAELKKSSFGQKSAVTKPPLSELICSIFSPETQQRPHQK